MQHKFYVVSTPIGNLKDISLRALEILENADEILCEDTRKTIILLNHYNIKKKLVCYAEFNREKITASIIENIKNGKTYALVSDAGTPVISDPGFFLVAELLKENIAVVPVPGASSLTAAISCSGINTARFIFLGFLSNNHKKTEETLNEFSRCNATLIFFESSKRILKTLQTVYSIFGDCNIAVVRELTKMHEQTVRGKISAILADDSIVCRGEMVVLVENIKPENKLNDEHFIIDPVIKKLYNKMLDADIDRNNALRIIADSYSISKNKLYDCFVKNAEL